MHSDIICGLDIGSSSIRALIAEPLDSASAKLNQGRDAAARTLHAKASRVRPAEVQERILGFSEIPTKGFSKGVVTNLSLLSDAIEDAVRNVENIAHCRAEELIANISGVHIRTFKSRGSIHISDRPSEITQVDITRCIASAKLIAMSFDRETLHLIPERFFIDDKLEIMDPLGLFGSKLDVDLNIITTLLGILQNLTKAINLAGYEVEEIISSGAGTALAIFDHKQLNEGAVIIDVGKDLTEAALFIDGKLKDCFYFPFGSDEFTLVLQDKLKIMFDVAEELRIKYGIVTKLDGTLYDESPILIPSLRDRPGSGNGYTQSDQDRLEIDRVDSSSEDAGPLNRKDGKVGIVSRREISNLLFPKVEEIMQGVYKKIEPFLKQRKIRPHISVVGGISKMDGFVEAIEEVFGVPVEMGRIVNAKDLQDTAFACCLGLTRYGSLRRREKKSGYIANADGFIGRMLRKVQALSSEYF